MGRLPENPSSDQTSFQPPLQSDLVLVQTPPPEGYPNHHDNPLSSPPPPPPQDGYNIVDNNYASEPTKQLPPPSPIHPPQQPPALYPPQQQPPANYPPQGQNAAYNSPVANGTPQMYSYSTPNHICQPQQAVNYFVTTGYQPPVTTGTPNWYQPTATATSVQGWSTGLLECFDDPENAIMTFCFPCVTFGQIAEIVDNGQTSCATSGLIYSLILAFVGIPCIMSCSYRTKVRSRYNLLETPAPDWVIHFFCEYCALCQEYRELKNRGMDPALGWQGNLVKQQQMANCATMTPPINQRMMG